MRELIAFVEIALCVACATAPAHAAVTVSAAQTQNLSCSSGVCAPTASNAVLNVTDLENLLAAGDVEVTTTGSGVQANDIDVSAPFGWSSAGTLSLDAYRSIAIGRPVSVAGQSGLSLVTNDGGSGGSLSFPRKGHVAFQNLSSQLTINGAAYALVNSISSLASAIAANPAGDYALAADYDASVDGTYAASPIQTEYTGIFEGLGNAISHLSIDASGYVGLFSFEFGNVENLGVLDAKIEVHGGSIAGVLSSEGFGGHLSRVLVTGSIRGTGKLGNSIGGLSGGGSVIERCFANVRITGNSTMSVVGGLVARNGDSINESFSTGSVSASHKSFAGGLVGIAVEGSIKNSYATGAVAGGAHSKVGGFVGENGLRHQIPGTIETSYSTGAVAGGSDSRVGGFAGVANRAKRGYVQDSYWDTTTSGTDQGTGKGNKPGITGLTTEQLQSGLPAGFDPAVWAEDPNINNGLPFLLANPPLKK